MHPFLKLLKIIFTKMIIFVWLVSQYDRGLARQNITSDSYAILDPLINITKGSLEQDHKNFTVQPPPKLKILHTGQTYKNILFKSHCLVTGHTSHMPLITKNKKKYDILPCPVMWEISSVILMSVQSNSKTWTRAFDNLFRWDNERSKLQVWGPENDSKTCKATIITTTVTLKTTLPIVHMPNQSKEITVFETGTELNVVVLQVGYRKDCEGDSQQSKVLI